MVGLILSINSPFPKIIGVVMGVMGLWWYRHWVWSLLILSMLVSVQIRELLPQSPNGLVSELNDRSTLVTSGSLVVLVRDAQALMIGDRLVFSQIEPIRVGTALGDRGWNDYVVTHRIHATASQDSIQTIQRSAFMRWCVEQWNKTEGFYGLVLKLLFQSDPLGEYGIILGTGLIYSLINRILRSGLSLIVKDRVNAGLRLGGFLLWIIYLGYPLSLLRYVVSLGCSISIKNPWMRWSGSVAILWLLHPIYLRSPTVLIPLFFQLLGVLRVDTLVRGLGFSVLQGFMWHRVSPLATISYSWLRQVLGGMILLVWLATPFPFLQPIILAFFNGVDRITSILESVWVVRGQASLLNLVLLVILFKTARKSSWKLAAGLTVMLLWMPILSAPWLPTLTIIDVGQGNAVLISTPLNQTVVLIDTGRANAYPKLTSVLDAQGIQSIDALILTHADADHAENADMLTRDYRVRRLITKPIDVRTETLWLSALDASLIDPTENQSSLVYGFKWGRTRYLLMGDAEISNERALLARYPNLETEVLLIGHHGSTTSTSSPWIGTLKPQLALISVGHNGYGHPSPEVMDRLSTSHIPIYTTRNDGSIRFLSTPWMTIVITDSWKLKVLP
jgi:beta-lactamase superfamily II metal-dependent hydrolase